MIANAAVAREIKNGSRCDVLLPPQVNGALKDNVRLKPQLCFLTYLALDVSQSSLLEPCMPRSGREPRGSIGHVILVRPLTNPVHDGNDIADAPCANGKTNGDQPAWPGDRRFGDKLKANGHAATKSAQG